MWRQPKSLNITCAFEFCQCTGHYWSCTPSSPLGVYIEAFDTVKRYHINPDHVPTQNKAYKCLVLYPGLPVCFSVCLLHKHWNTQEGLGTRLAKAIQLACKMVLPVHVSVDSPADSTTLHNISHSEVSAQRKTKNGRPELYIQVWVWDSGPIRDSGTWQLPSG